MDEERLNESVKTDGDILDRLIRLETEEQAMIKKLEEAKEKLRRSVELASQLTRITIENRTDVDNLRLLLEFNPSWTGCLEIEPEDVADRNKVVDMVAVHNNRAGTELVRFTYN